MTSAKSATTTEHAHDHRRRPLGQEDALDTGWVNVNESTNYWEAHLNFGGRAGKKSGIGRLGGRFALEQMTDLKTIVIEISPE